MRCKKPTWGCGLDAAWPSSLRSSVCPLQGRPQRALGDSHDIGGGNTVTVLAKGPIWLDACATRIVEPRVVLKAGKLLHQSGGPPRPIRQFLAVPAVHLAVRRASNLCPDEVPRRNWVFLLMVSVAG